MATFTTTRYPGLVLQDDKGVWAAFKDGAFETSEAAVIKRLKALPDEYEVTEASAAADKPPAEQTKE